jgi:hypothetical protein
MKHAHKTMKTLSHSIISEETYARTQDHENTIQIPSLLRYTSQCQYLSSWKHQFDLVLELGIYPSKSYNGQPTFKYDILQLEQNGANSILQSSKWFIQVSSFHLKVPIF